MGKRNKITFWLSLLAVALSATALVWVAFILKDRLELTSSNNTPQQVSPILGNEVDLRQNKIIVVGDKDYPPYSYLKDGIPTGFDVDTIKAAAQAVGLEVEIKLMPWDQAVQALLDGKADIISGMAFSPERSNLFEFSNPSTTISFDVFTRQNSEIKSLADLKAKCVLLQKGSIIEEYLGSIANQAIPVFVENPVDALRKLSSGECDAAIVNRVQGYTIINSQRLTNLKAVDIRILPADYGFAALPKNSHLIMTFNEGLNIIYAKGEFRDLYSKWFGVVEQQSFLTKYKYLIYGSVLILVMLILVLTWLWALRREVKKKTLDLTNSEKKYRQLVENVSEAVIVARGDTIVFCNAQAEQLLGGPLAGYSFETLKAHIYPDDIQDFSTNDQRWELSDEIKQKITTRINLSGSDYRWVNIVREKIEWEMQPAILNLLQDITQEKKAQLALKESEIKFRTAFESAAVGLVISGVDGRILQANNSICSYLGYSESELCSKAWRDITHPDDIQKNEELRQKSIEDQRYFRLEKRYICKDGSIMWGDMSTTLIEDQDHSPIYYITYIQNISDKRAAEETIHSLAKFPEQNPSPVMRVDRTGKILYANPFCAQNLPLGCCEMGSTVSQEFFAAISPAFEQNKTVQFSDEVGDRIFSFLVNPCSEDGYVNVYGFDITERNEAEEALARSEQQYRLLFDRSPIGLLHYDTNLVITEANGYATRMFDLPREELIHNNLREIKNTAIVEAFECSLKKLEGSYHGPLQIFQRDQTMIVEIHTAPIMTEDGELLGGIAICNDLTEKVNREKELHQLEDKFAIAFKTSLDAVIINHLADGKFLEVNPGFTEMTGYSEKEVIGKTIEEFDLWQNAEDRDEFFRSLLNGNEIRNIEVSLRRKDGTLMTGLVSAAKTEINGEPCVITLAHDISERKKYENEVRASEERFRRLFEESPVGIEVFDRQGNLVNVNTSFLETFGLESKESIKDYNLFTSHSISGLTRLDFSDKNYLRFEKEFDFNQFAGRKISSTKSGKIYLEITAAVLSKVNDSTDMEGFLIQTHDITERKSGEEKLRESEKRYRTIFDTASVSLWEEDFSQVMEWIDQKKKEGVLNLASYIDANPGILRDLARRVKVRNVNDAAMRMYHCDSKEQLCNSLDRILCDESYGDFRRLILNISKGEAYYEGESVNLTLTGEKLKVLITSNFPFQSGDYSRVLVSLTDITRLKNAEERVKQQVQHLAALRAVDMAISASMDMNITLRVLLSQVKQQLSVDAVSILLLNPHTQTLDYAAGTGFRIDTMEHVHLRLGQSYAGKAALERRIITADDLNDPEKTQIITPSLYKEQYGYFAGIPLIAKGSVKGVLEVFGYQPFPSDTEWMNLLEAMASQAAIAIDNASMFDEVQRANTNLMLAYDATIEGWARALEMRDGETEGHSKRVTDLTTRLATLCGIPDEELIHIRRGAFLHDIGKMGIPDSILLKPGPLTEDEWKIMHMHPTWGKHLLESIDFLKPAMIIPYCHHEKYDGTGYPQGLKGEEIPLAARVFSIIDGYDALSSDRPYRKAWPKDQIRIYLQDNAGKAYDPDIVKRFLKMLEI